MSALPFLDFARLLIRKLLFPLLLLPIVIAIRVSNIADLSVTSERGIVNMDIQKLTVAILWFAIAITAVRVFNLVFWQRIFVTLVGRQPPQLLTQFANFLVYFITLSLVMSQIYDYSVTSIWAASGALSVVIGLALRKLIMDTFSGLAI